jgi:hypothetical protein
MMDPVPPGTKCAICREHEAAEQMADSVLDAVHGFVTAACTCCMLRKWIAHAEAQASRIEEWKAELATACDGQAPFEPGPLLEQNDKLRQRLREQWQAAHCGICGPHYPGRFALNYAVHEDPSEWCYWPKPEIL